MIKSTCAALTLMALLFASQACSHNGDQNANSPANSGSDMSSGGSDSKGIKQLDALGGKDQSGPPVDPASSDNCGVRSNAIAFAAERDGSAWTHAHSGDELGNGASGPSAGRSGSMHGGGRGSAGGSSIGGSGSH
jgi:hypothetical protein